MAHPAQGLVIRRRPRVMRTRSSSRSSPIPDLAKPVRADTPSVGDKKEKPRLKSRGPLKAAGVHPANDLQCAASMRFLNKLWPFVFRVAVDQGRPDCGRD